MWFIPTNKLSWQIVENVSTKALKLWMLLWNSCSSAFIAWCARCIALPFLCTRFSLEEKFIVHNHIIVLFCRSRSSKKNYADAMKEFVLLNSELKKRRIQTFSWETKTVFVNKYRACKSSRRGQISILINKISLAHCFVFSHERDMDRD